MNADYGIITQVTTLRKKRLANKTCIVYVINQDRRRGTDRSGVVGFVNGRKDELLEALYIGKWMTGQEILADAKGVPEGSIYPNLLRLEKDGLVEMQVIEKADRPGRRGRRYRITAKGQKTVEAVRAGMVAMGGVLT
jgi:Transcriptional regulator PadR-like family